MVNVFISYIVHWTVCPFIFVFTEQLHRNTGQFPAVAGYRKPRWQ